MRHDGEVLDRIKDYSIINCGTCGFIHIDPIPSQEELDRIYREEYYTEEKPLFIQRCMEDIEWWNVVYDDRYDFFEKIISPDRRRILDIGCGPGFFLERGKERGWECLGIEPSKQAATHAKGLGLDVENAFFGDIRFKTDGFDVIHLSEVLEHTPDPTSLCKRVYTLLSDGGIICVVVPNDYNPFQTVLRERLDFQPYWLAPPHHINYFSFDSLESLLKKVGFNIAYRTAMFPMDIFLLMGDNYVGDDAIGRQCHARRKRLDILLNEPALKGFKRDIYKIMAQHGIGREMIVYGRR